jgi:ABC-type phosphate/phosphonate transport system substrate-binding protein
MAMCAAMGASAAEELVFAVNEGVTYRITPQETRERYRDLADVIGRVLDRDVRIEPVDNYNVLRKGYEDGIYDIAYIHPAHHALRAIRDHKYQLVALTRGFTDYKARFLVKTDSPLKAAEDIQGQRLVTPDADSITAWMVRATLRDLKIDLAKMKVSTTRYQDGIPFFLTNGFTDVGSTASGAVVRDWQAKGGRVLFESRPVPIKIFIASSRLRRAEVERLRRTLTGLDAAPRDRAALQKIGFAGFIPGDEATLAELTRWLGL